MRQIAFFLAFAAANAFAYTPTVESLFRNGSNGDIGQNTVSATFVLQKKETAPNEKSPEEAEENPSLIKKAPSVFTYKILFSNFAEKSSMVQVVYEGAVASAKSMSEAAYYPRVDFASLRLGKEQEEKKFFYALMASLLNNDGSLMVSFLNDIGAPVKFNTDRADREQLYYLDKYVKYLKLEDDEREEKENPLEPKDPETAQKIQEVFKRPFLTASPYVKRVKEGDDFYWIVETEQAMAKFSHDDHKLLEMKVKTDNGTMSAKCFNYILFGQDMQFPELLVVKDLAGTEHLLTMRKISAFSDTSERFIERVGDFKKSLNEEQKREFESKPSLTL